MSAKARSATRSRKAGRGAQQVPRRAPTPLRESSARRANSASAPELLLEAALEAFARHGFDGVSLSEIARDAGAAQPLIHHYFGSKRGLWEAAADLAFRELGAAFEEARTELEGLDVIATLKVLLRRYVLFTARRPEVHLILAREAAVEGERLEWLIDRHVDPLQRAVEELITEAQAQGRVKPIPLPQLVQILNGAVAVFLCSGPLMERLYGIDPRSREEVTGHVDALTEVIFHGIEADDIEDAPARKARRPKARRSSEADRRVRKANG